MSSSIGFSILVVVIVGAALAMQAPANAVLAREPGDPTAAGALSFAIGVVVLVALASLRGVNLPSLSSLRAIPWWALTGGVPGAVWIWVAIWSVPRPGVVAMFGAMIVGQLIAALLLDARGAFRMEARAIDPTRILAIAIVASGVVLSKA